MKKLITTILLTLALTSISFAGYGSSSGGFPSSYSSYSKPSSVSFSSSKPSVRTSSNYTPPKPSVSTTTAVTFSNASVVAPTTIYKPSYSIYQNSSYLYRSSAFQPSSSYYHPYYNNQNYGYNNYNSGILNNHIFWYLVLANHNQGYNNRDFVNHNFQNGSVDDWTSSTKSESTNPTYSLEYILSIAAILFLIAIIIYGVYVTLFKKI